MITPEELKAVTPKDFWGNIKFGSPYECWEWTGYKLKTGYGSYSAYDPGCNVPHWFNAHRYGFMQLNGQLPSDIFVCHKCENKLCTNPNHLWAGTNKDNLDDMVSKGLRDYYKGENHAGAKLTTEQVKIIKIRLAAGKESQTQIGKAFGVSTSQMSRIKLGQQWKKVAI